MGGGLQNLIDSARGLPWDAVINNLASQAGGILLLVEAIAYLLGVVFMVSAFIMAAKAANPAARSDTGKSAWFWSMVFGTLLMALPSTIASISVSVFGDAASSDGAMAYMTQVQGTGKLAALVPLLKLFGVIAVVRGLVVYRTVSMYGNYSKGNATFGRGTVLVIAGVMLVHMKLVLGTVSDLTGMSLGAGLF
jgi:hypothetical protein